MLFSQLSRAKISNRRTFVRFGRIILVTLAPLLGLSAISAVAAAGPAVSNEHKSNSLTRLLLSVVTPMVESSISSQPERPSPQAVLLIAALADTPFQHSLWMVASQTVLPFSPRSQHRSQLRC
jgi:hypothetical protein